MMHEQTRRAGIIFFSTAIYAIMKERERRVDNSRVGNRRTREYWVHPYYAARAQDGRFARDVSIEYFQ